MVQSGDEYREKNRIRLQRFYEKQKRQGKKRVSALVSDEAYRLLTDEKEQAGESMSTLIDQAVMVAYGEHGIPNIVSDEAYALLMDAKEQTGQSMPILIDRAVMAAFGHLDILDIDDPALSEDFITNFEGPGQDGIPFDDIESDISLVDPEPETDDAAGGDLVKPAAQGESESETAQADAGTQVETDPAIDDTAIDAQDPEIIPDCTGKTITIEQRDKYLLLVDETLPGRSNAQARVDLLNQKGIPVYVKSSRWQYGGEWTKKKFRDNLKGAKQRPGIE